MLRLVIHADNRHHTVALPAGTLRIGAATDNDVVLSARGVSRHHAICEQEDLSVVVRDLGSKNGVVSGGRRVDQITLTPNVPVQLGSAMLWLEEISTSDAELALRMDRPSGSSKVLLHRSHTSAIGSASATPGPWQWARLASDGGAPPDVLLDLARQIAGADSLIIFNTIDDDIALMEVAGFPPDEPTTSELVKAAAARKSIAGDWSLAYEDDGVIAASCRTPAKVREFLTFALHRLRPKPPSKSVYISLADERLTIPNTMVRGHSDAARRLLEEVGRVAATPYDVLLLGERGSGKEFIARVIHENSRSRGGPFIAVNCSAVTPTILESELFGVARGAATDVLERPGFFIAAEGGTIFLDEIGDMAVKLQSKLLRVLQEREVTPVGSAKSVRVNVRVISSTNQNLNALIAGGEFRADLYDRVKDQVIEVPPLRDRREDIPALALAFLDAAARETLKDVVGLSARALRLLMEYGWPGNIRELKTVIRRAVVAADSGRAIRESDLGVISAVVTSHADHSDRDSSLVGAERRAIQQALNRAHGKVSRAAALLGIARSTLYQKMKQFGIRR